MAPPLSTEGWIYFVGEVGSDEFVKIGLTRHQNARVRVRNLNIGNPRPLEILALWKVRDVGAVEALLHRSFKEHHIRGEWFRLSPVIRDFMKSLPALD